MYIRESQNIPTTKNIDLQVSRKYKSSNTIVTVGNVTFGDTSLPIIAGPCSVESQEQIDTAAQAIYDIKSTLSTIEGDFPKTSIDFILRGGLFKARTSPYSFQGLGSAGIPYMNNVKTNYNLPLVTEITDISQIELLNDFDMLQVGARNMQNFELLKALGKLDKPILLKRSFASTLDEFLCSAEYIYNEGNHNIILCERGIRTFDNTFRNTLDLAVIPYLKEKTHLPVIVDPSHAIGNAKYINPIACASILAGADGLMLEIDNLPHLAISDAKQTIDLITFKDITLHIQKILPYICI